MKDFSLLALAGQAGKDGRYARAKDYINRALLIKSSPENYIAAAGIIKSIPGKKTGMGMKISKKPWNITKRPIKKDAIPFVYFKLPLCR